MTSLSGGWERIENLSGGLERMTWPGKEDSNDDRIEGWSSIHKPTKLRKTKTTADQPHRNKNGEMDNQPLFRARLIAWRQRQSDIKVFNGDPSTRVFVNVSLQTVLPLPLPPLPCCHPPQLLQLQLHLAFLFPLHCSRSW